MGLQSKSQFKPLLKPQKSLRFPLFANIVRYRDNFYNNICKLKHFQGKRTHRKQLCTEVKCFEVTVFNCPGVVSISRTRSMRLVHKTWTNLWDVKCETVIRASLTGSCGPVLHRFYVDRWKANKGFMFITTLCQRGPATFVMQNAFVRVIEISSNESEDRGLSGDCSLII